MKKKMNKLLSMIVMVGFCAAIPVASLAAEGKSDEDIIKEINDLRSTVSSQQTQIDALKDSKTEKDAGGKGLFASGNDLIDRIQVDGDLRARYELLNKDKKPGNGEDTTRDRFRSRFRLGFLWDNEEENWQVGAGLATGDDTPTSTNTTWSEAKPFETEGIMLDYAYAKHKKDSFSATLGQQPNPYKTAWVMWDGDVRPVGLTLAYNPKEGIFATGGAYAAKYVYSDDTAMLYMGQAGYNGAFGAKGKYTIAAGYQTYTRQMIREDAALGADAKFGFGSVDSGSYGLDIGDLYCDVNFPVGPASMKLYGQAWMNFSADGTDGQAGADFPEDPEDNDMGWVLGAETKINKFKAGYAYSRVEADSLFGYLADADFGDGLSKTNKKGHKLSLGYSITKNWSADVTCLNYDRIVDYESAKEDRVSLGQLDLNYKF